MKIEKEDIIKLMDNTVIDMWFTDEPISEYENAITLMCGKKIKDNYTEEQRESDINKVLQHIGEYSDFKIENIYQVIYKYQPWNFMSK